jgi:hypothetical protein
MVLGDVFGPSDALVAVAAIGVLGTLVTSAFTLRRAKRTEAGVRQAVHNTQPNGHMDEEGNLSPPSAYDSLVSSHEYMIGQIHAATEEARDAKREAILARAAVKRNDVTTANLGSLMSEKFAEATTERHALGEKLEKNIADGAAFAQGIAAGALGVLGRLDALDGQDSVAQLTVRLEGTGLLGPVVHSDSPPEGEGLTVPGAEPEPDVDSGRADHN